jgi:hypothetical protein
MRATRYWNGTKSSRNRFLALGFSNVLTNDETAVSYSVFRLIQLMSGRPGQRVIFRLLALPNLLSQDNGSIAFASRAELTRQWISVLTLQLQRDWIWDDLADVSFEIADQSAEVVGTIAPSGI